MRLLYFCMLQAEWWTSASRKQWVPWLAVFPWGARILSFCFPCYPWWAPQSNHAVCTAAGRYTHTPPPMCEWMSTSCYKTIYFWCLCFGPGSFHICFGELSSSGQQFHQLCSRPRKPLPSPTRPASPVGLAVKPTVNLHYSRVQQPPFGPIFHRNGQNQPLW